MMSTWAASDPLRHPWFTPPSLKRKHSDSSDEEYMREPDSDQDGAPIFYPIPPPESAGVLDNDGDFVERKRRRCDTIERRMARMYIDTKSGKKEFNSDYSQSLHAHPMSAAQSNASNTSYAYTAGSISPVSRNSILQQYAIEEPPSPEFLTDTILALPSSQSEEPKITEVRMKGAEPAWYEREKDRIVITDLDEAAEEAEEEEYKSEAEPHPDAGSYADSNADYSISAILLDHIKRQSNFPFVPKIKEEEKGALVLFKPPPASFFTGPSSDSESKGSEASKEDPDDVQVIEIDARAAHAFSPLGKLSTGTVSMEQESEDVGVLGEPMDMDVDIEL